VVRVCCSRDLYLIENKGGNMGDYALVLRALHFAADKHRDHRRKDIHASPYINHPIYVAQILSEVGIENPDILAAAILHDTVEDTETSLGELALEFGERTARIVAEVTDNKSLPKEKRKCLQIEHAPELSDEAALVKVADKISNVKDVISNPPDGWDEERRKQYVEWASSVVGKCQVKNQALTDRFWQTVAAEDPGV
jgi:(p)ppGpp synthase/HD superfamily hydrolase